jgi:hypothetical protein
MIFDWISGSAFIILMTIPVISFILVKLVKIKGTYSKWLTISSLYFLFLLFIIAWFFHEVAMNEQDVNIRFDMFILFPCLFVQFFVSFEGYIKTRETKLFKNSQKAVERYRKSKH